MELINKTKTNFLVGKDAKGKDVFFRVGRSMKFADDLAKTLLRYDGIESQESLSDGVANVVKEAEAKSKADAEAKAKSKK
jgi:hypothetical protein